MSNKEYKHGYRWPQGAGGSFFFRAHTLDLPAFGTAKLTLFSDSGKEINVFNTSLKKVKQIVFFKIKIWSIQKFAVPLQCNSKAYYYVV